MNYIKETIKDKLQNIQIPSGEYMSEYIIYFILSNPITFEVLGITYNVDRIIMENDLLNEDTNFYLGNQDEYFKDLLIPKYIMRAVYKRILKEQKDGFLKGWNFKDEFYNYYYMISNTDVRRHKIERNIF
jgi:hypothetical protein